MVAVQLIESPNIISIQIDINKSLEAIDRIDLINIKLISSQKDSLPPPAKNYFLETCLWHHAVRTNVTKLTNFHGN